MTDWSAFSRDANKVVAHFTDDDLKRLLLHLEPTIFRSLTIKDRLLMQMGFSSSVYKKLFDKIDPAKFENAPPEAIEAYNALVKSLFGEKATLIAQKEQAPREQVVDKKVDPEEEKKRSLAALLPTLPNEPPAYLQPLENPERWQAFVSNAQTDLEAASVLAAAKALAAPMDKFLSELKSINQTLYLAHVAPFHFIVEEKLYAKEAEAAIRAALGAQKEKLLTIEKAIHEQTEVLRTKGAPLLQQLFSPELLPYTDLPQEANSILGQQFSLEALAGKEVTDDMVASYKKQAESYAQGRYQEMQQLIKQAKERTEKLESMNQYARYFFTITAQAKSYKDLEQDYSDLEEQVKALQLTKQDLLASTFSENEALLQARFADFLQLKVQMPKAISTIIKEAIESEVRAEDDKSAIKRRLFEIFWSISPYQDLNESFLDMRAMLTEQLKGALNRFYAGKLSSRELLEMCQEMPYEHDVVKLRNEITHRSARLKDLRDELVRLDYELLDTKRFLEIAAKDFKEILELQKKVAALLHEVENPFSAFAKAVTKDDINYVFRSFWIRVEELQPKIESAQNRARAVLKPAGQPVKAAFLRALDTLEELVSQQDKTRPPLVQTFERDIQHVGADLLFETVLSQIHSIEKRYSFVCPFSFFMLVPEHKVRLKMMQEAFILDTHIRKMIDFAKAMQYVKTFEEERVDIILEAFEKQHLIDDDWDYYRERMHRAARLVEDEIFLDIGLLDRHALMDVDPQELNKTLRLAAKRAREHIFEPKYGLLANLHELSEQALCKKMFQDVQQGLESWANVQVDETKSTDWLLEHLRSYCHSLFDAKITISAESKMSLGRCLAFMNELRSLEKLVSEQLQTLRSTEWVEECHTIRALIECFEPAEERAHAFLPLIKEIQNVLNSLPEKLDLEPIQKELEAHLAEIDELAKDPKKEHPFIYIPGYLAFFDLAVAK